MNMRLIHHFWEFTMHNQLVKAKSFGLTFNCNPFGKILDGFPSLEMGMKTSMF